MKNWPAYEAALFHLALRQTKGFGASLLASRDDANPDPRQSEAPQALMLALAHGYPSLYAAWFSRSALAKAWVPIFPSGRVFKLRRIALSVLGEYL